MDVLYILGAGSKFKNRELKFSLRTLQKHLKDVDRVVIVGENPGFLSPEVTFKYIPEAEGNKEYRIAAKICNAIKAGVVSNDFLFFNDDFFLTQNFSAKNYPYYFKSYLNIYKQDDAYSKALQQTHDYLYNIDKAVKNFDVHLPIIYNASKFLALENVWNDSQKLQFGLVVKSTYCNYYNIKGLKHHDTKLRILQTYKDFERIYNTHLFTCYDYGFVNGVEDYLEYKFPEPSKYELSENKITNTHLKKEAVTV